LTYKTKIILSNDDMLALRKGYDHSALALVTNRGSNSSALGPYTIGDTNFSEGDEIMDVLSCTSMTVGAFGVVNITIPAGGNPMVWVPVKWMLNQTLCPTIVKAYKAPASTPAPTVSEASSPSSSSSVFALSALILAAIAFF